jgi:hypothetical protein
MKGSDKHTNVILEKCYERVFSPTGTEIVELGLYIIKGDNMYVADVLVWWLIPSAIIGEVDPELEATIDYRSSMQYESSWLRIVMVRAELLLLLFLFFLLFFILFLFCLFCFVTFSSIYI